MLHLGRFSSAAHTTACLLALIATLQVACAYDDVVTLRKAGEKLVGRIKQCDLDNISVEISDKATGAKSGRDVTTPEVGEIEWDGDNDFHAAQTAFKQGNYGTALRTFHSMQGSEEWPNMRAEVKAFVTYADAECLYRVGKAADAFTEFDKFVNDNPKNFYVPLSVASMVDAAIQEHKFDTVGKLLTKLREFGPEQKALADYYEGNLLRAQGKPKEADRKYGAAADASKVPETQAIALMGQAQCALEGNELSKARDLTAKALEKSTSPKVAAFAHLIAGAACMKEADPLTGQKKLEKLTDAVLEFLRDEVQYGGDPRTQPEAMYKAGQCLEQMAKLFPESHGADRGRAVTIYNRLVTDSRFRGSSFSNEAAKSLQALK